MARKMRGTKRKVMRRKMVRRTYRSRYSDGTLYRFKRTCECKPWVYFQGAWAQQGTATIMNDNAFILDKGVLSFQLADLPNYNDFLNLYEKVKIKGVKLRFIPYKSTEATASTNYVEPLALTIDKSYLFNGTASPTFTEVIEDSSCIIRNTQRPFSMYVSNPKTAGAVASITRATNISPWLDTSTTNVQYIPFQGVKFCFQTTRPATESCGFRVFATYYIHCKGPQ